MDSAKGGNNLSNASVRSETAAAVSNRSFSYGVASGLTVDTALTDSQALSTSDQFNFLFSEYFKGLLFVLVSSMFIFAVPVALTRHGSIKGLLMGIAKRAMDIIGSLVGLILTIPFWLVIPAVIKLDSPGPVFYTQTRIGLNRRRNQRRLYQKADVNDKRRRERRRTDYMGKPFKVLKFRTMVNDAEKKSGPVWASKGDPRITRIGKLLRKTRIDEIPQFLNVLKGDMSLVGPRPERPSFVMDLSTKIKGYSNRLNVRPGLTGLAQVENGYDSSLTSVVRKVRYDLEYIEKRGFWTDIKIMLKTVIVVLTGRGAC
ncbi:MAG: sugar transferase [Candidatus Zixiibacteriota bacterium]|nr:MAG: sugar transferase [candidate division Zixibacteria bacterium]